MFARNYKPGDEDDILELFNIVFDRPLDEDFWRWRFLQNPFGESIIRLMFDDDKLVGHYALIPMPLWLRGSLIRACFSMTTMTHPDFQGRGIFTRLATDTYDSCKKYGVEIIYGFPNQNSYHGFTIKLGWKGFDRVLGWELNESPPLSNHSKGTSEVRMENATDEIDDLWESVKKDIQVGVPRTSQFFNWRYFQKPGREYKIFGFRDVEGVLHGITVLKIYKDERESVGHIVDMLFDARDDVMEYALKHSLRYFLNKGIAKISCWVKDERIVPQLQNHAFRRREWPVYFGAKLLDENNSSLLLALDSGNWWITMGDSDVF